MARHAVPGGVYVSPGFTALVTRNGTALASSAFAVNATTGAVNLVGATLVTGDVYVTTPQRLGSPISGTVAAGAVTVPGAPTITLTASAGQVSVAWTDGAINGAAITAHKLYRGTVSGTRALVGTISTASPYVDAGLAAGTY